MNRADEPSPTIAAAMRTQLVDRIKEIFPYLPRLPRRARTPETHSGSSLGDLKQDFVDYAAGLFGAKYGIKFSRRAYAEEEARELLRRFFELGISDQQRLWRDVEARLTRLLKERAAKAEKDLDFSALALALMAGEWETPEARAELDNIARELSLDESAVDEFKEEAERALKGAAKESYRDLYGEDAASMLGRLASAGATSENIRSVLGRWKRQGGLADGRPANLESANVVMAIHIDNLPEDLQAGDFRELVKALGREGELHVMIRRGEDEAKFNRLYGYLETAQEKTKVRRLTYVSALPIRELESKLARRKDARKIFVMANLAASSEALKSLKARGAVSLVEVPDTLPTVVAAPLLHLLIRLPEEAALLKALPDVVEARGAGNGFSYLAFNTQALTERLSREIEADRSLDLAA
jgi:hypothetical protein